MKQTRNQSFVIFVIFIRVCNDAFTTLCLYKIFFLFLIVQYADVLDRIKQEHPIYKVHLAIRYKNMVRYLL